MTVLFLKIYASNVASFAGRHKYKKQADAFIEVLHYNNRLKNIIENTLDDDELFYKPLVEKIGIAVQTGETATSAVQRACSKNEQLQKEINELFTNAPKASEDDIAKLRLKCPRTEDVKRQAVCSIRENQNFSAICQSTNITSEVQKRISEVVQNTASQIQVPGIKDTVVKELYCERGSYLEKSTLDRLYDLLPQISNCIYCKEQQSTELNINVDNVTVKIPGMVDLAIQSENNELYVVEVKNRVNRFFVPGYDLDQLALYITALQAKSGYLVQQCNGNINISPEMTLTEAEERYNTSILPDLQKAVRLFVQAVENPLLPEHYKLWSLLRISKCPNL